MRRSSWRSCASVVRTARPTPPGRSLDPASDGGTRGMVVSSSELNRVVRGMDANNLQLLVNLSGSNGDRLRQGIAAIRDSQHRDRMVLFANVSFRNVGPGFGPRAAKQLEDDIKAGAKGLKVFKDLGMFATKA